MPELPEVETVRRILSPQIAGQRIQMVDVRRPEVVARPDAAGFVHALAGQRMLGMRRRGKFLQIPMESGDTLAIHLRMTGCLLVAPIALPPEKHTHISFHLEGGSALRFSDLRRFGRLWLIPRGEEDNSGVLKLGPEACDPRVDADYLRLTLAGRRRPIKDCLLDQAILAGIGNIYADEILFSAKIRPDRLACSLTDAQWRRLAKAIPERLLYFIEKDAMTPEEYLAGRGTDYRNGPFLQVYGHAGKPCPNCGTVLRRITIAGRGSVFCTECQNAE